MNWYPHSTTRTPSQHLVVLRSSPSSRYRTNRWDNPQPDHHRRLRTYHLHLRQQRFHRGILRRQCHRWIHRYRIERRQSYDHRDPAWSDSLELGHCLAALHRDLSSPSGSKHHLCGYSNKVVTDSSFSLDANATSGLPVSFTSLHTNIATVDDQWYSHDCGHRSSHHPCNSGRVMPVTTLPSRWKKH